MTKEAKVRDKNLGTHGDTTGSQPMGSWSSEVHEITVWGVKLNTPTNHCLEKKKKKAKTKTKNYTALYCVQLSIREILTEN